MKKLLKTTVVIAGLAIALLGFISKVSATENNESDVPDKDDCGPGQYICILTTDGTKIYGDWR